MTLGVVVRPQLSFRMHMRNLSVVFSGIRLTTRSLARARDDKKKTAAYAESIRRAQVKVYTEFNEVFEMTEGYHEEKGGLPFLERMLDVAQNGTSGRSKPL